MTNSDATNRISGSPPAGASKEVSNPESPSKASRSRSKRNRSRSIPETLCDDATLGSKADGVELLTADRAPEPSAEDASATVTTRYQAIGEVGRGGWGVVERAVDRQLNREVAVKRFSNCSDVTEDERRRFLHEARVTSQLQHPGIVPVHELGDRQDAFYVMKLLDGVTFRDFIENHHKAQSAGQRNRYQFGESLEPLLQRFVDICHAVAYAHQRGVVHRDLKPSNVMVSDFGETVVLDWGLATSPNTDDHAGACVAAPAEMKTRTNDQVHWDPDGTVIGTPAYMSPEQAAGDVTAINFASDIYSLGLILYTIIAGKNPYHGQSIEQILQLVKSASCPGIRTIQPLTPSALVSIVEKAMAAAQNARYESAEQLASDVRRFIAGDSVAAHRENIAEQAVRWGRRHQGISATIAISVSVLLISAIGFGIVIKRAHRAEQQARIEAQHAHQEAVLSLSEARDATDTWLLELSGSLQFYPGMENLRSDLLDRAIGQYQRITQQSIDNTETRKAISLSRSGITDAESLGEATDRLAQLERAKTALRLGDLYRLTGKLDSSGASYRAANNILKRSDDNHFAAANSSPQPSPTLEQQFELERVNALIGQLLVSSETHNDAPSTKEINSARHWTWRFVQCVRDSDGPLDSFTARVASACVRIELAVSRLRDVDSNDEGLLNDYEYRQAISVARWLAEQRGTVSDRRLSETVQTELAQRLTKQGQHTEAFRAWDQLIIDLDTWSSSAPERIDYLQSLSNALLYRGNCLVALGEQASAISDFEASIVKLERAWRLTDHDGYYRTNLATAENNLGQLLALGDKRDPALARRLLSQSLQTYEALLKEELTVERLRRFAMTHYALSSIQGNPSQPVEQEIEVQAAHAHSASQAFDIVKDYEPLTPDELISWLQCQLLLARHQATLGDRTAATQHISTARQMQESLVAHELGSAAHQQLQRLDRELGAVEASVSSTQLIDMTRINGSDSIQ